MVPVVCLALAAMTWLVFGQTLRHEFINYDDGEQIYQHPVIRNGLSWEGIVWVFSHSDDGHWTPLNKISHMLDCQFYGLKPGGHHMTNVLFHSATAILLFLVLRRMTGFLWRSAFVAAVFAIHPLRVESVAWVAERKDVLSGFFFMLTLWAYVRYVQKTEIRSQLSAMGKLSHVPRPLASVDYWLALLFFACGLMSKAMVVTLPLLLLLLDFWPLHRFLRPWPMAAMDKNKLLSVSKRLILEKIPFLGPIVAVGVGLLFSRDRNNVVVAVALLTGQGLVPHKDFSPMAQTGHALLTPLVYFKQMFCPVGLVVFSPPSQSVPRWEIFMAIILLTAISVVVVFRWRKQPYLVVGWFWYLIMLAPILMLIRQGAEVRCDRYTYLPQIGLYILVAWGAMDLCGFWRHRRMVLGSVAAVVITALGVDSFIQTSYWRNSESLWTYTLTCTSDNAIAHNNLGNVFLQQGPLDEAIAQFQKALAIEPFFEKAHYNLGTAFLEQRRTDEAIAQFRKALEIKPDYVDAHNNLANALLQKGNVEDAISHYQKALAIKPDYAEILNNLAWVLSTTPQASLRNGQRAIKLAQRANQLTGDKNPLLVRTLATAYAEAGRFSDALETAQRALQLAEAQSNPALADVIRSEIKLYQAGVPFHLN